jgi:alpha-beta hydrolase superfamily lysophospholipase
LLSVLTLPVAPLFAAFLSYRVYHPPRRPHHKMPDQFGLPSTELHISFPNHNGQLHVWLCPGDTDRVVVVGHGIGLTKSASLLHAKFLHNAGYTVAMFDHRNHGGSSQDRALFGLSSRFTIDVALVVKHLRAMPEYRDAKYAVYGFSFSTFPVLYVLMRDDCPVDAIICDSGPAMDSRPLFRNFLHTKGVPVPAFFRTHPSRFVVERIFASLGTAMVHTEWPPPASARYMSTPMLFLAGDKDSIVPAAAVEELAAHYPHAEFTLIRGAEHLQGLKSDPNGYRDSVVDFLKRALG